MIGTAYSVYNDRYCTQWEADRYILRTGIGASNEVSILILIYLGQFERGCGIAIEFIITSYYINSLYNLLL